MTREWLQDECEMKIDKIPFAHGAMRECFRKSKYVSLEQGQGYIMQNAAGVRGR